MHEDWSIVLVDALVELLSLIVCTGNEDIAVLGEVVEAHIGRV